MRRLPALILTLLVLASCSTTRLLTEGQSRLVENKIQFDKKTDIKPAELAAYVKQKPNSYFIFYWSPGLSIYNWADTTKTYERGWNKFCEKAGVAPVVYDETLVDSSIENIETRLEYLGYYDSKVSAQSETKNKLTKVKYFVELGKRYQIDSIDYSVPEGAITQEFREDMKNISVKPGDWLSEASLEKESERSATYFRNLGYYDFGKGNYFFEADTLGSRNILHYAIKNHTRNESDAEGLPIEKYRFGDISIAHAKDVPFRESLLRKINILQPGQLYSETAVNTDYSRFASLKVFNSVGIELQPQPDHTLDCNINLRESKMQGVKFNIEASTNASALIGIAPKVSYYHKNVFKGGERLTLDFSGNFQFQPNSDVRSTELTASLGLNFPRFIGLPMKKFPGPNIPHTDVSASYSFQDRPEYKRNIASLSFGYNGQIGKNMFYQVYPIQINYVYLNDISDDFAAMLLVDPALYGMFERHINAGLTSNWYYTTNSDLVPKTPYHFIRLNVDTSGNLLSLFNGLMPSNEHGSKMILGSPYSQFARFELSLGKAFRWGQQDGQALAMRLLMGAALPYGNSTEVPFEKKFYAGGASSMRAWQARSLGPGYSPMNPIFAIPSQSGNYKLEFDLEYRFKMFWKLEGALFAEAGNIWETLQQEDFIHSIAADWGIGLRVNLDFILIRVDGGFKLYDPFAYVIDPRWLGPKDWFSENGYAIHLGVGYPF